jgi:hypothetical protein
MIIPPRYKEELCLSLLESLLLLNPKNPSDLQSQDSWLLTALEAAEICSKSLDWKIKHCQMGEAVSQKYLNYVEEVCLAIIKVLSDEFLVEEYRIRA